MKKLLLGAALVAALVTPAQADLWTAFKNSNLEPKAPTAAYRVETQGLDVRVYEWTSQADPNVTCSMAFGRDHPVGMQCWTTAPTPEPTED